MAVPVSVRHAAGQRSRSAWSEAGDARRLSVRPHPSSDHPHPPRSVVSASCAGADTQGGAFPRPPSNQPSFLRAPRCESIPITSPTCRAPSTAGTTSGALPAAFHNELSVDNYIYDSPAKFDDQFRRNRGRGRRMIEAMRTRTSSTKTIGTASGGTWMEKAAMFKEAWRSMHTKTLPRAWL